MQISLFHKMLCRQAGTSAGENMHIRLEQLKANSWSGQLRKLIDGIGFPSASRDEVIHPCVIDNCSTLIHAPDLSTRNPAFYERLHVFAEREGYVLQADRRRKDSFVTSDRRRAWLPVFMFSLGLNTALMASESVPNGDHGSWQQVSLQGHSQGQATHTTLALFDAKINSTVVDGSVVDDEAPQGDLGVDFSVSPLVDLSVDNGNAADKTAEVEAILREHYNPSNDDPDYIDRDLHEMADYFSRYPEAVSLIRSLQGHAWQLVYANNTFETEVRGNQIQVKSVRVNFDSRAAAQLRSHRACKDTEKRGACVASPADALLHELLHAKSALLESREFIEQGGMSSVIYPFAHENAVIKRENALYQSMTAIDGSYRPNRHSHAGRVVVSACVTCLN